MQIVSEAEPTQVDRMMLDVGDRFRATSNSCGSCHVHLDNARDQEPPPSSKLESSLVTDFRYKERWYILKQHLLYLQDKNMYTRKRYHAIYTADEPPNNSTR